MSTIQMSSLLRRALLIDAIATASTGLMLAAGAPVLAGLLGLPAGFLVAAGVPLVPFAGFVAWLGTRRSVPAGAVRFVMVSNALWVAASIGILAARLFEPTQIGVAFVLAQAAAVAAFAEFQFVGLRRAHGR